MAKSKKEINDKAKLEGEAYSDNVKGYRTPYSDKGVIGDVTTNTFTENAQNSSQKKLNEKQMEYFHNLGRFDFKHGLEVTPGENGDEDHVVFGFDIIIHTQTSPLFSKSSDTKLIDFFAFGKKENLKEVMYRENIYTDFVEHFSKFFKRTDSEFKNIKSFYVKGIEGLENLVNKSTAIHSSEKKQFVDYGKSSESIKLTMYEDNYLNSGYLAMLYKTLSYSKINGKQIIPENLLRFDMSIIVSEMRSYNKILKSLRGNGEKILNVVNDNISRYKYNLYDCQFNFDNLSHPGKIKNDATATTDEFTYNIFYKFSTLEMEKFNLNLGGADSRNYINDGEVDIETKMNGDRSNVPSLTDFAYRTNTTEYIRMDVAGTPGNNVNTFYQDSNESIDDSESGVGKLKKKEKESNKDLKKGVKNDKSALGAIIEDSKEFAIKKAKKKNDKSALGAIIEDSKEFAIKKAKKKRDEVINSTLQKIRTSTGLRRISSPTNVYKSRSTIDFIKGEITDFANTNLTDFIENSPVGNPKQNNLGKLNKSYNERIHGGSGVGNKGE